MEIENGRILEISDQLDHDKEIEISIDDVYIWISKYDALQIINHLSNLINNENNQ